MKQYMLAHMIEKPVLGDEFSKWPLHITILPWFRSPKLQAEFLNGLDDLFFDQTSFSVTLGAIARLGPLKNINAHLLADDEKLKELHQRSLAYLEGQKLALASARFVGDHYLPHITDKKLDLLYEGQELTIDSVDVIEALSEWPHKKRRSIYRVEFK